MVCQTAGITSAVLDRDLADVRHRMGLVPILWYRIFGNMQLFLYDWFYVALICVILGTMGRIFLAYQVLGCRGWILAPLPSKIGRAHV